MPLGAGAAHAVHETGGKKTFGVFKGYKLNPYCKSKTAVSPNLAAYLVEVIFIIRETFKQKATCNRKVNQQMQKTRYWQELGTRGES